MTADPSATVIRRTHVPSGRCLVCHAPTAHEVRHYVDGTQADWYSACDCPGSRARETERRPEPADAHDWRTCPCQVCRGQRSAHAYLTVPTRFTP